MKRTSQKNTHILRDFVIVSEAWTFDDDNKKKSVSARGIIDILKRYNFTIEENTPLDQEVSLDPELHLQLPRA